MDAPTEHMALGSNGSSSNLHPHNDSHIEEDYHPNLVQRMKDVCQNIYFMTEIVFCILVGVLGHDAPSHIFGMTIYEREIPYQKTANGDVILDSYINRDYVDQETIPDWQLIVYCVLLPFVIVLLYSAFLGQRNDLHASACAYLFASGCTGFITNSVKLYVGYWRPNFYNYCGYNENDLACEAETANALIDSRKSFPSGHASASFCGMTFLSLFFMGKIGLYRGLAIIESAQLNESTSAFLFKKRIQTMLAAIPILYAIYVASTRVHDDMHHPADIVAGSVIGMICSSFSYGLW